jgi:hypothetical protein
VDSEANARTVKADSSISDEKQLQGTLTRRFGADGVIRVFMLQLSSNQQQMLDLSSG